MLLLLKKLYRLLRIIVHVLWGVVQAVYYLDDKNTLGEKEQRFIRGWCNQFLQLLHIEKKIHGDIHPGNHLMVANHIS